MAVRKILKYGEPLLTEKMKPVEYEKIKDMELSVGDFILTGGELAAAVVVDCVTRLQPGVFRKAEVPYQESFCEGLLEAPQYTRPAVWRRMKVPEVLMGGNHKTIAAWRKQQALALTKERRPDLLKDETEEYNGNSARRS